MVKMNTLSLPGIKKIGYIKADVLPRLLVKKALANIPIAILTGITYIDFTGEPSCKAVSNEENNGRLEECTLSFSSTQNIPTDWHIAFVIQCVNGKNYLIGSRELPAPRVKISNDTGTRSGNAALSTVEISHIGRKALLEVII